MSLGTREKVEKLQAALHAKAKGSPSYRFYTLYDKLYREDVLEFAYRLCRRNGGAAGVDGECFEGIEVCGVDRWLGDLTEELRSKTYRPQAVRRVWIPKPDGTRRPLGIPTVRDRVVQTATGSQCAGRRASGAPAAEYGAYGGRRRGPEGVLRRDPARGAHEIGGPSRERPAPAGSDQAVAPSTSGGE
jgi:hypothetical protein